MSWNYRVVRRYGAVPEAARKALGTDEESWIEITEVHYEDGKPCSFAVELGTPMVPIEPFGEGESETESDAKLLDDLRDILSRMLAATCKPILDERDDFKGDAK